MDQPNPSQLPPPFDEEELFDIELYDNDPPTGKPTGFRPITVTRADIAENLHRLRMQIRAAKTEFCLLRQRFHDLPPRARDTDSFDVKSSYVHECVMEFDVGGESYAGFFHMIYDACVKALDEDVECVANKSEICSGDLHAACESTLEILHRHLSFIRRNVEGLESDYNRVLQRERRARRSWR